METKKKNSKGLIIGLVLLVVAVAAFAVCFKVFGPKTSKGSKNITIEVVNSAAQSTTYKVSTDAEYLRQAMEEAKGLEFTGSESEYGLYVETVNGELADYSKDGAYWSFYVNGEYCNYGVDAQPVADGDAFSIVYEVYSF